MIRVRLAAIPESSIASVAAACMMSLCFVAASRTAAATSAGKNLTAYREHLQGLHAIVADCQKQRTTTACDASRIGNDDKVTLTLGGKAVQREIRYDWLRALFVRAAGKDDAPAVPIGRLSTAQTPPPSVDALLKQALERLSADEKEEGPGESSGPTYQSARRSLSTILAQKEYKSVNKTTLRERIRQWISNQLDRFFDHLIGIGSHIPWLAKALRALFIGLVCLALVWMLIRIERRSRIKLSPDLIPAGHAPSAREWQLWLADARNMAEQGAWREAIHFLYWSVISRLESGHVWTADRARTPREYLRLVSSGDPRKEDLTLLTRSFERTWYGGRPADTNDYQSAVKVAEQLGVK
jgi:hypothetical protein